MCVRVPLCVCVCVHVYAVICVRFDGHFPDGPGDKDVGGGEW